MELTSAIPQGALLVESYRPGRFRVAGQDYLGSILIMADGVRAWPVAAPGALDAASLDAVLEAPAPPEVMLVGCAGETVLLPSALRQRFRAARIGLDAMPTGAACRTYNVLVSENRRVGAALIAL